VGSDGIRTNKDGKRLEIVLNAFDAGVGPAENVMLIQGQLRQIGIDVKLKAQARPPWYEDNYRCTTNGPVTFLRSGDWDALYVLFHSSLVGSNFNWTCTKDPELDKLLLQGRQEADMAKRRQIYVELEKRVIEQALVAHWPTTWRPGPCAPNTKG